MIKRKSFQEKAYFLKTRYVFIVVESALNKRNGII